MDGGEWKGRVRRWEWKGRRKGGEKEDMKGKEKERK